MRIVVWVYGGPSRLDATDENFWRESARFFESFRLAADEAEPDHLHSVPRYSAGDQRRSIADIQRDRWASSQAVVTVAASLFSCRSGWHSQSKRRKMSGGIGARPPDRASTA